MILLPLFFLAYIAIWIVLVLGAGFISWRSSRSKVITSIAVLVAFFIMYWPAFGDLIPTLLAHKQYCEKEAGFKVYVTPEQWAAENPGVLETLVPYEKYTSQNHFELGNERFGLKFEMESTDNAAVRKETESLVDIKTKQILSQKIDFSRGYWHYQPQDLRSVKMWLDLHSCYSIQELQEHRKQRTDFFKKLNTKWGN